MKSAKTLSLISLSSILMMACQNTASSQTIPTPTSPPYVTYPTAAPPAAPAWTPPASSPVGAIEQAADPSAAIQAYAYAHQIAPNDIAVEQTYVRRMVTFGLPEMAESQANDVLQRQPTDGIAWAVAAYMHAKRDQTPEGLASIALAAKYAPQDPFVLRTAGQLVAWYDTRAAKGASVETQNTVKALKTQLAANPDYADAYAHAVAEYGKLGAEATTAPETAPANQSAAAAPQEDAQPLPPDVAGTYTPGYAAPVYAAPDYVAPDYISYPDPYYAVDPYAYWYPTPCWTADWWWPSFGSFVVIDDDFRFHHRDFDDHDGDGRHDRAWSGHDTDPHWVGDRARGTTVARTGAARPEAGTAGVNRQTWENRATDPLRAGIGGARTSAAPTGQTARVTSPALRGSAPALRGSAQAPRSVALPQQRSVTSTPQARWEFPRSSWSTSRVTPRVAVPQTPAPQFSEPRLSGARTFSTPGGFGGGREIGGGSGGGPRFSGGGGGIRMGGGGGGARMGGGGGHGGGGRR